jgi:pimeloyl-ACP methyl ester carboxylesterase
VRSLVALNAPHPAAFAAYLRRRPSQLFTSSYMLFMMAPRLPEWLLTRNEAAAVAGALRRGAHPASTFSADDLAVYRRAMLRPGAATATLNYYRQAVRQGARVLPSTPIAVPTLVLWGEDDPLLQVGARSLDTAGAAGCGEWRTCSVAAGA